jgi:hypothetical protein
MITIAAHKYHQRFKSECRGKTVKQLKTFIKDRLQRNSIPNIDLSSFKGLEEHVESVFLNWQEVGKIYYKTLLTY